MAKPRFRLVPYRLLPGVDWSLIVVTFALLLFGIMTLWGATSDGEGPGRLVGFAARQCIWAVLGLAVAIGLTFFDYRKLRRVVWIFYGILIGALVLLLIRNAAIKGARSWFSLGALGTIQPSEFGKIVVTLALAHYLALRARDFRKIRHTILPLLIVGAPMLLILAQPDLGTAVVLLPICAAMFWVAGLRKCVIFLFVLAGVAVAWAGYPHLKPYQKQRIGTFLDPKADPRDKGYNILQAQTTLGSGELLGRGWGRGTQTRLRFLPEFQTDFIFPTVGEQFGLVGCVAAVVLFTLLVGRLVRLAAVTRDMFGVLILTGLSAMLATHFVLNIGMTVGLLPITGLPLPFFSYGGSFMLTCMTTVGLALSIGARRGL